MADAPRLVYGLVSGEYSDYGVHAIFSTYEAAAREAERINALPRSERSTKYDDACEVQPFLLDPTPEQLIAKGGIEVHIDERGDTLAPEQWRKRYPCNPFAAPYDYSVWRQNDSPLRVFVGYGLDAERARRAADEFRCMVLMYEQAALDR